MNSNLISINQFRSRHIERMVDQRLDSIDEVNGMRQAGVIVEGCLVFPARVNVERLRIADGSKRVNANAARLFARRAENITQRLCHSTFLVRPGMKTREDE